VGAGPSVAGVLAVLIEFERRPCKQEFECEVDIDHTTPWAAFDRQDFRNRARPNATDRRDVGLLNPPRSGLLERNDAADSAGGCWPFRGCWLFDSFSCRSASSVVRARRTADR